MHNKENNRNDKVLDLVLDERWWNYVKSGDKKEEYRLVTRWSILRFINEDYHCCFNTEDIVTDFMAWYHFTKLDYELIFRHYDVVRFHLGYPIITMSFKIESIRVKSGEFCSLIWGADPDKYYFVIKLGERID